MGAHESPLFGLLLLAWLACAIAAPDFAYHKRRNVFWWGLLGLFLGPLAAILAGVAPPAGLQCRACRERIDPSAELCPHCRTEKPTLRFDFAPKALPQVGTLS